MGVRTARKTISHAVREFVRTRLHRLPPQFERTGSPHSLFLLTHGFA